MKPSAPTSWSNLTRLARADAPPSRDIDALVIALRHARSVAAPDPFFGEVFATLFATPRALSLCTLITAACTVVVLQQGSDVVALLSPWLEFVGIG